MNQTFETDNFNVNLDQIHLANTIEKFNKNCYFLSWSKYNTFQMCNARWFSEAGVEYIDKRSTMIEDSYTIPGYVIQKLFEIFINKRIYVRSDMTSYEAILSWFKINFKSVFELVKFTEQDQYLDVFKDMSKYTRTTYAKARVDAVVKKYGMDREFRLCKPKFVNQEKFLSINGSEEEFIAKIEEYFNPILLSFLENKLDLDKMLSEYFFKVENFLDNITIWGATDFIYSPILQPQKNMNSTIFSDIKLLEHGYTVFDGKLKLNDFVSQEQLEFYATAIYLETKKTPSNVGFIDWSTGIIHSREYDQTYPEKLSENVLTYKNKVEAIKKELMHLYKFKPVNISVYELQSIEYTPSFSACNFCQIKNTCPKCDKKIKMLSGVRTKDEVKSYLKTLELDKNNLVNDVNL